MKYFTSPQDLTDWVRSNASAEQAQQRLQQALGTAAGQYEDDLQETVSAVHAKGDMIAAKGLFQVLSKNNLTEMTTANVRNTMQKIAFYRQDPTHINMRSRMCPKLPRSTGQIVSTAICREHCLDSIYFDEDPDSVYCAETLWRKHIADKFAREWQDKKTGDLIGGYIANRFHTFPTAGTPSNPDVPRDGNNRGGMRLAPWERSRQPAKHEWSIERRMQEQRDKNSTKSITLDTLAETNQIKTAQMTTGDGLQCLLCERIEPHGNNMHGYGNGRDLICDVCASETDLKGNPTRGKCANCENYFESDELTAGTCQQCTQHLSAGAEQNAYHDVTAETAEKVLTAQAKTGNLIRLASTATRIPEDHKAYQIFSEALELKLAGIANDEAVTTLSTKHGIPVTAVVSIQASALRKLASHESDVYAMNKTAQSQPFAPADNVGGQLCVGCQKSSATLPCGVCGQACCAACKDMTKTEVHTCQRCGAQVETDATALGLEGSAPVAPNPQVTQL